MSAFHFQLQTLLRLRMADRDERRADLAKALRAEEVLEKELRQIEVEQADVRIAVRERSAPGAADVDALLRTSRYQLVLKARRGQLATQLEQVLAEIDGRRQALVEAHRQVRVLEKLRERQQAAHRSRQVQREANELDEAAASAYSWREKARLS
jgi:flagellar FliJ protein